MADCHNCGYNTGYGFCTKCGTEIIKKEIYVCPNGHETSQKLGPFCEFCGQPWIDKPIGKETEGV